MIATMPVIPDIRVVPVESDWHASLIALRMRPGQEDFVSPVARTLADALQRPDSRPMAVFAGQVPIGFYRTEARVRTLSEPAVGLRSFLLDADWQGRGLGQIAMEAAIADAARYYPAARLLALTVNVRNTTALRLYLRAGFVDTGELYMGGRSGPQHLLVRKLRD